ncbi:Battenin [Aphelenchoides fujianensis]|nr:Battenin [Aphelenchoides fujianensis]
MMRSRVLLPDNRNNLIAFWLFGVCNNFAYVVMLSAAKDILEPDQFHPMNGTNISCVEDRSAAKCSKISTGAVLLAGHHSFAADQARHPVRLLGASDSCWSSSCRSSRLLWSPSSGSAAVGLSGVVLASLGSGLGDVTLLALSSHFPEVHSFFLAWASGTGAAGVFGALAYAFLTDQSLLDLTPRHALLSMLVVPVLFTFRQAPNGWNEWLKDGEYFINYGLILNAFAFAQEAMHRFIPHIGIVFVWVLYEGVLGGTAYAHTFHDVHTNIPRQTPRISLAFVTLSDSIGIVFAGFSAIPAHNYICTRFF